MHVCKVVSRSRFKKMVLFQGNGCHGNGSRASSLVQWLRSATNRGFIWDMQDTFIFEIWHIFIFEIWYIFIFETWYTSIFEIWYILKPNHATYKAQQCNKQLSSSEAQLSSSHAPPHTHTNPTCACAGFLREKTVRQTDSSRDVSGISHLNEQRPHPRAH